MRSLPHVEILSPGELVYDVGGPLKSVDLYATDVTGRLVACFGTRGDVEPNRGSDVVQKRGDRAGMVGQQVRMKLLPAVWQSEIGTVLVDRDPIFRQERPQPIRLPAEPKEIMLFDIATHPDEIDPLDAEAVSA